RIYPGGVAGDEPAGGGKKRVGGVHAAGPTSSGRSGSDGSFRVVAIPLFFCFYPALFQGPPRLGPGRPQPRGATGGVVLNWGHGGWVHFFTRTPVQSIDELRKLKIFVWAGDDRSVQMWKANGFNPVALAATDILPALQTGMIDALPSPPLAANLLQWFRQAPYMADIGLGPLAGALIITKSAWSKISPADQTAILAACEKTETRLARDIPGQ